MRRRERTPPGFVEPPPRLLAFDEADWLPLVDVTEYHPDDWRNIRDHVPYGLPRMSFEDWRRDRAWHLWSSARLDWCERHGWRRPRRDRGTSADGAIASGATQSLGMSGVEAQAAGLWRSGRSVDGSVAGAQGALKTKLPPSRYGVLPDMTHSRRLADRHTNPRVKDQARNWGRR